MRNRVPNIQRRRSERLILSQARLRFGRQYAEANQTSLSRVVEELLGALEQTLLVNVEPQTEDPLDGLLAGWPSMDKKDLRNAQHEAWCLACASTEPGHQVRLDRPDQER